jgi:uncharacterized membrane protein YphA (DoxX/SURF4 family)
MPSDADRRAWGVLFARLILGLMFSQGTWWRVFGIGPIGHARWFFVDPYSESFLPTWSLWAAGTAVPFAELIGGALVLLGGVLVLVTFGHLVHEPFYSFSGHVFPRLILVVLLLLIPASWDRFSVDEWRARRLDG